MKTAGNYKIIALMTIVLSTGLFMQAQDLSKEQQAVWKEVENKWKNWKDGDLNAAFKNIHEGFLGWNDVDPTPVTKEEWVNSMKEMQNSIIEIDYKIKPERILIYKNSAVVHYYYQYTIRYSDGKEEQKMGDNGKWSEFFVNDRGRWLLIGEFTFHVEASKHIKSSRIETFTFLNNGTAVKGKIYLPAAYNTNKNLPVICLIDFTEQHFKLATDEFEKVIAGVEQLDGFDALVVSLEGIPDIDAEPESYQEHYQIYKNMVSYVSSTYSNNTSRTFIGKGSESGVVLMSMFLEDPETSVFENFIATDPSWMYSSALIERIEKGDFPKNKANKKLHFSFSTSNDRVICVKFIELINQAQYPWLQFESKEYTDSNYENTYPFAFAAGLKYVIKDE